jgi:Holliday junction DNA helicase RuvA
MNGVGYKVFATGDTVLSYTVGKHASLWTYLAVRDTAMDLYGFPTIQELNFFELLISVSGIGPKTALGILNVASVNTLHLAIQSNDTSHLTKVSGIGKKNAEKIVLELKDKIDSIALPEHAAAIRGDADIIEALRALGYRDAESREALKKIDRTLVGTGAKIKAVLKILSQ